MKTGVMSGRFREFIDWSFADMPAVIQPYELPLYVRRWTPESPPRARWEPGPEHARLEHREAIERARCLVEIKRKRDKRWQLQRERHIEQRKQQEPAVEQARQQEQCKQQEPAVEQARQLYAIPNTDARDRRDYYPTRQQVEYIASMRQFRGCYRCGLRLDECPKNDGAFCSDRCSFEHFSTMKWKHERKTGMP